MTTFRGFPRELFTFFEGLRDDNSNTYWTANNAAWQQHVREPMLALLADLADEFPSSTRSQSATEARSRATSHAQIVWGRSARRA